jgi:hypothetical protein
MSCHFVVLLISHFRDTYPHLPVPLHLTGSDSCEIFFSKIGRMVGLERTYDFHELVALAHTLNHLAEIEFGHANGLQFRWAHNKMENVWARLHLLKDHEAPCDLEDYIEMGSKDDIVAALKEGLREAQKMLSLKYGSFHSGLPEAMVYVTVGG